MDDRPLAIVDIDGVVADVRHRLHHISGRRKDWDAFFGAAVEDAPHEEGLAVVARLGADHEIVFLTGRPERCRADTQRWLDDHGLGGHRLFMRPEGVRRPAAEVKRALLDRLAEGRRVAVVVDDDTVVLAAMERDGRPTFRADWAVHSSTLHHAQEVEGRS